MKKSLSATGVGSGGQAVAGRLSVRGAAGTGLSEKEIRRKFMDEEEGK